MFNKLKQWFSPSREVHALNESTTTSFNDPIYTSFIAEDIYEEQRPYNVMVPLFKYEGPHPTKRMDWPTQTDPGPALDITEGTALTNSSIATGVASATAAQNGMLATATDLLSAVSTVDIESHFARVLARSVAEEREDTAGATIDDFTNVTGTSGSDLTVAQFHQAVNALEQRDTYGNLVAVLHPIQVGDLRSGVQVTSNAHFHANPQFSQSLMTDISTPAGYAGSLFGVDIFQTSAVTTNANAADREGAIFTRNDAVGYYELWDIRVETHREITFPGTAIVATSAYGMVVILDRLGQLVRTDA